MLSEPEMLEDTEMLLLLEGISKAYGLDFHNYDYDILKCRIRSFVRNERIDTIAALLAKVLHDPSSMERLTDAITINYTSMFLDPDFYLALRKKVVPVLKTYPLIRIWVAGCSTGQEAYSLSILLEEEGIYDRCRIYATDVSKAALEKAKTGAVPLYAIEEYADNYRQAGGTSTLDNYYKVSGDVAVFQPQFRKNIVFAEHNLVTDGSFNEFNLVLARSVMPYFNDLLRDKVLELIHQSLSMFGILSLGKEANLQIPVLEKYYEEFDAKQKLYRRCV